MKKLKNTLFSNKPVTIDENSLIMAIESSCDETACAIVKGGREVLANVVASQIKIHEEFGGVIPEIAAREHLEAVNVVVDERTGRVIMMGAMDNLVKGAAGQAVQNMNLMFGLPEDMGLQLVPMFP